jgi:cyclase
MHLVELGAGEILLNSIDRDGMMGGYDLAIADKVAKAVAVPVIVCGGAGNFQHLADAFQKTAVSAAACASLFHFGDNNPIRARSYLRNLDIPMRVLR